MEKSKIETLREWRDDLIHMVNHFSTIDTEVLMEMGETAVLLNVAAEKLERALMLVQERKEELRDIGK